MIKLKNKGGVVFSMLLFVIIFIVVVYLILLIPIPAFAEIRAFFSYWGLVLGWFGFQVFIFWAVYQIGTYTYKAFFTYRKKLNDWSQNIKKMVVTHK